MTKTILITGASSGIGRAAADKFDAEGWNVVATMPSVARAGAPSKASRTLVTRLDVRDEQSIATAIKAGKDAFGRIDAVLSNAGYGQYGVFESIPPSRVQDQFDVNVFGAMNLLRAILPEFREQGHGQVLVTSSSGGIYGLPTMALYITTKFALEGFFDSVAYELSSQNISVKLIEPGGVDTAFHEKAAATTCGAGGIASYQPFYDSVARKVEQIIGRHQLSRAADVAQVIYDAAMDGTDRLRYVVGPDAAAIIESRKRNPESEFRSLIRSEFGLEDATINGGQVVFGATSS